MQRRRRLPTEKSRLDGYLCPRARKKRIAQERIPNTSNPQVRADAPTIHLPPTIEKYARLCVRLARAVTTARLSLNGQWGECIPIFMRCIEGTIQRRYRTQSACLAYPAWERMIRVGDGCHARYADMAPITGMTKKGDLPNSKIDYPQKNLVRGRLTASIVVAERTELEPLDRQGRWPAG